MLRAYITGHPLDAYDTSMDGITHLNAVDENSFLFVGLVTNLRLKNRKADGKPMAFFTLEDKTGTIEVSVFTAVYGECARFLKEGKAVSVTGRCHATDGGMDENGIAEKKWQLIAESMAEPTPAKRVFLPVSSYYRFHVEEEKEFRKRYENPSGYRLVLFDETLQETREALFRVSERVFDLPKARKL